MLERAFVARLCHISVVQRVELQPHCTAERERMREVTDENNERRKGRQTKHRESDSKDSRGWWLPWDASGWRGGRGRDGGRAKEEGREGGSHVRSHVSGRGKKVGSGYRVRDWPEA